ncbi:MAG: glycoside hydrolase family 15 protein [Candidatus Limnocylindrales bacterium]
MIDDGRSNALASHSLEVIRRWQTDQGAFLASPSFSQYGYSWLRDGAFISEALDVVGDLESAARFHAWVANVVLDRSAGMERAIGAARAGLIPEPSDYLHCRYAPDGTTGPEDWPTFQLDGPGIWLWSLGHHVRSGGTIPNQAAEAGALVARYLAALRHTPASDAWEEFPQHVHTSTLGAVVAGLRGARDLGLATAEVDAARDEIEAALLGPSAHWTKWADNSAVDASLTWLVAPYGLVEPDVGPAAETLRRIESELEDADGGVHRYLDDTYYGGGAWTLNTAYLARARLRRGGDGDRQLAERALRWIEAQADGLGDLPEQVPTRALHPGRIDEWRELWGESARPLLWSHASYLVLRHELGLEAP